jgi:citrate lyase beta subunit
VARNSLQSLPPRDLKTIATRLRAANRDLMLAYPGETAGHQPVHTFYGGAHLFAADTAPRLGAHALAVLEEYAPHAASFGHALNLGEGRDDADEFIATVRARVVEKLQREPVEDFRIDFEDGYGSRPDAEEDGHAASAAREVANAFASGTLPSRIGLRIKPMSNELHARSLRTLDIFMTTLARTSAGGLPPDLVVTVPKVMIPEHVRAAARACGALERQLGMEAGTMRLEIMIETPQSIIAADGSSALRSLVAAGEGRVMGAHFGIYDYTALCGITAAWQHMRHPACDFARHMLQVSLAQTGVSLSDGGTNVMPVPLHRATGGRTLSAAEDRENREAVHRAWRVHFDDVTHSLSHGYYQGWDLHPAQLPTRYAAVFAFYRSALPAATARLRAFVEKAAQATLVGDVFDDAATGQGLLNFFVRGLTSGALTLDEAAETGLTREELEGRSFVTILQARTR